MYSAAHDIFILQRFNQGVLKLVWDGISTFAFSTYLQRIVDAAQVGAADEVLEVGAGLGSLTRHLAAAAGNVCAVESDSRFMPVLKKVLADFSNITLVNADIMEMRPQDWMRSAEYLASPHRP